MSLVVRWVTKGIIICKPVSKGLGLNTCTDRRALMFGIFIDLLEAILEHRLKSVCVPQMFYNVEMWIMGNLQFF